MAIPLYLAMTAAEFSHCPAALECPAWMSCRFSPCGQGLSNLPAELPAGTLLILDDQTPPAGHNAELIRKQLSEIIETNRCSGLLLDFQRPNDPQTAQIAAALVTLPCPVCVSHLYAKSFSCPVFLPPCPLTVPLAEYIRPWRERQVWLEAALGSCTFVITEQGCRQAPCDTSGSFPHTDNTLHCHYHIETAPGAVRFSLRRTPEDLSQLLQEAEALGVTHAVGLWQELTL